MVKAVECTATYLLLNPGDETMTSNQAYYAQQDFFDPSYFITRQVDVYLIILTMRRNEYVHVIFIQYIQTMSNFVVHLNLWALWLYWTITDSKFGCLVSSAECYTLTKYQQNFSHFLNSTYKQVNTLIHYYYYCYNYYYYTNLYYAII